MVYVGKNDKLSFLSDKQALKACKRKYEDNKLVEIYELSGLDHGFMNPTSPDYDEDASKIVLNSFKELSIIS